MTWTVTKGDCLKVMRSIPDQSVDACITDPPYGTTACKWDSVIPFDPMWAELKRIVKPHGAIVLFASQPFTSALVMSNPKMFRYQWVWNKKITGNPFLTKVQPLKIHEDITIFSQRAHLYKPEMRIGTTRRKGGYSSGQMFDIERTASINNVYFPNSILEFSNAKRGVHLTQKPVDLLRYLVRTYTNEAETVLDFTCGSGTTGVACALEGRNFIGIEREREYVKIARQRIAEASRMEVAA